MSLSDQGQLAELHPEPDSLSLWSVLRALTRLRAARSRGAPVRESIRPSSTYPQVENPVYRRLAPTATTYALCRVASRSQPGKVRRQVRLRTRYRHALWPSGWFRLTSLAVPFAFVFPLESLRLF